MGTLVLKEEDIYAQYLTGYGGEYHEPPTSADPRVRLEARAAHSIGVEHRTTNRVLARIGEVPPLVAWLLTGPPAEKPAT